ncbi:MAG: hypothetical protein ACYTEZ_19880 [Planctomycetota bacterium]
MSWEELRSDHPPPAVRLLLLAETLGYVAGLIAYVYLAVPTFGHHRPVHFAFWPFALLFPVLMNLIHNRSLARSGVRLDNLGASAREVVLAIAAMVAVVGLVGLVAGTWQPLRWEAVRGKLALYAAWGPIQQYGLCAFVFNRLRQAGLSALGAALCAAVLFAMIHSPNWVLVGVTACAGFVSCLLFRRHPNIFSLGLAHGVLALAVYYAWPPAWHQGLTIGGIYLHRVATLVP